MVTQRLIFVPNAERNLSIQYVLSHRNIENAKAVRPIKKIFNDSRRVGGIDWSKT